MHIQRANDLWGAQLKVLVADLAAAHSYALCCAGTLSDELLKPILDVKHLLHAVDTVSVRMIGFEPPFSSKRMQTSPEIHRLIWRAIGDSSWILFCSPSSRPPNQTNEKFL